MRGRLILNTQYFILYNMINKETLEQLKKRLEEEKKVLQEELGLIADKQSDGNHYVTKFPDMGTDQDDNTAEVSLFGDRLAIEKELETRLGRVKLALEKIEAGTYGVCETCGDEISIERLGAFPSGRHCMKCHSGE